MEAPVSIEGILLDSDWVGQQLSFKTCSSKAEGCIMHRFLFHRIYKWQYWMTANQTCPYGAAAPNPGTK